MMRWIKIAMGDLGSNVSQLGYGEASQYLIFPALYWPEMPYILTVSLSLVFKNVLSLQKLLLP